MATDKTEKNSAYLEYLQTIKESEEEDKWKEEATIQTNCGWTITCCGDDKYIFYNWNEKEKGLTDCAYRFDFFNDEYYKADSKTHFDVLSFIQENPDLLRDEDAQEIFMDKYLGIPSFENYYIELSMESLLGSVFGGEGGYDALNALYGGNITFAHGEHHPTIRDIIRDDITDDDCELYGGTVDDKEAIADIVAEMIGEYVVDGARDEVDEIIILWGSGITREFNTTGITYEDKHFDITPELVINKHRANAFLAWVAENIPHDAGADILGYVKDAIYQNLSESVEVTRGGTLNFTDFINSYVWDELDGINFAEVKRLLLDEAVKKNTKKTTVNESESEPEVPVKKTIKESRQTNTGKKNINEGRYYKRPIKESKEYGYKKDMEKMFGKGTLICGDERSGNCVYKFNGNKFAFVPAYDMEFQDYCDDVEDIYRVSDADAMAVIYFDFDNNDFRLHAYNDDNEYTYENVSELYTELDDAGYDSDELKELFAEYGVKNESLRRRKSVYNKRRVEDYDNTDTQTQGQMRKVVSTIRREVPYVSIEVSPNNDNIRSIRIQADRKCDADRVKNICNRLNSQGYNISYLNSGFFTYIEPRHGTPHSAEVNARYIPASRTNIGESGCFSPRRKFGRR